MSLRGVLGAALLAILATPTEAFAVASAELFRTESRRYGRFEARIRYAAGDGVVSSFFLWKDGSEMPGTFWNELDFEKLGATCYMQTNTLYGNPVMSSEQSHTMPSDMCEAYHDYRFEWTPTYIAWFIDGREIRRETGASVAAFEANAPGGMNMRFNVWPGNANFGGNFNPAILPVRQYISWVQYSSFQNGNFQLEWREDFNGNSLPAGWDTGNWPSPYELSTHNAANVTFANGIAVLSLTADGATGFTGTPPPDTGGMAGSGGTGGGAGGNNSAGKGGSNSAGRGGSNGAGTGGMSQGGMPSAGGMSQGGMPSAGGAGGTSQGGASGSGTAGASGGVSNSAGAAGLSAGGTSGMGVAGAPVSTAGTSNTAGSPPAGTAGASGVSGGPSNPADDPSGCGCYVPKDASQGRLGVLSSVLLALVALVRRRGARGTSRRAS
jgi:hypothetical protein